MPRRGCVRGWDEEIHEHTAGKGRGEGLVERVNELWKMKEGRWYLVGRSREERRRKK